MAAAVVANKTREQMLCDLHPLRRFHYHPPPHTTGQFADGVFHGEGKYEWATFFEQHKRVVGRSYRVRGRRRRRACASLALSP